MQTKLHKFHQKSNLCSKFYPNRTMGKCSKSWGKVWMEGGVGIQGWVNFEKNANIKNSIPKLIYVIVSSKSDSGKVFKNKGKYGGPPPPYFPLFLNTFPLSRSRWISKKNAYVTNAISKCIYVGSFIQIRQWEIVKNRGKFGDALTYLLAD